MDPRVDKIIGNWQKRNISGLYFESKDSALDKILGLIPLSASIGFSGSVTLDQMEIIKKLQERGSRVFNPYKPGITREESFDLRRQGAQAQYYLASTNGISQNGELVFFSGFGNRSAGIANAKNVIIVCGINKIAPNLEEALKRAREFATPLNCKRLNWQSACLADGICHEQECFSPEYKRMCCQVLIIESEVSPDRLKVVLIGENLGF